MNALACLLCFPLLSSSTPQQGRFVLEDGAPERRAGEADRGQSIALSEVLAVERMGVRRRSALYTDALEAELARGTWQPPSEGAQSKAADGSERTWQRFEADENGWISGRPLRGGWAYAVLEVPQAGAWRLNARGHAHVFVDGVPHAGDVYALGTTRTPLALGAGAHELLFRCGRGRLHATLEPAPAAIYFEDTDRTVPDVLRGTKGELWIGQIVANASERDVSGLRVLARAGAGAESASEVPLLLESSYAKCAVRVALPAELEADELEVSLRLVDAHGAELHRSAFALAVREASEKHTRTFVSEIDGSVQYFALTPPAGLPEGTRPALFLSLHGASVEARNQAYSYAPKDWGVVVAPTNRRPFGFDWEDWGRLDALEVWRIAEQLYDTDPRRTYLTGHSMGGHGTWQIGAHFGGRFAAIAPSAGWRDFWSYAGGGTFDEEDPIGRILTRAANASRTSLLERNYLHGGVYVLHGDADDNVPVREARAMRQQLAAFHPNFAYYERPGAGHWWGNQCMDWPPLFEFLKTQRRARPIRGVRG